MGYRSVFAPGLFAGRVMLVTGGGSGIGRCTAHELAALGATVLIAGRRPEKLAATVAEIQEDGGTAVPYAFDIRDEIAVRSTVRQMLDDHGRLDGLVNNAGGQFPMPLAQISKRGWEAVVANNLTGGFLVAREVYTQWMQRNGGSIVNMLADMWGGMPNMGHSGAARAGMMNLTETAAIEWGVSGVRVNAVAPGYVASSGMDHYDPVFATEVIPKLKRAAPLQRMAEEAEVAAAIVFLLSPGAAFITGSCLKIDGGSALCGKVYPLLNEGRSRPFEGFHRAFKPKAIT